MKAKLSDCDFFNLRFCINEEKQNCRISPKCKGNNIFFHLVHYIKINKYQGHFNQCLKLEILAMQTKCFGTLGSFYRFVFHDPLSMFWGGWGFWCWMVGGGW